MVWRCSAAQFASMGNTLYYKAAEVKAKPERGGPGPGACGGAGRAERRRRFGFPRSGNMEVQRVSRPPLRGQKSGVALRFATALHRAKVQPAPCPAPGATAAL